MLGKLMKYEWNATWKMVLLMNLFTVIMSALGCIGFAIVNLENPSPMQMLMLVAVMIFYCLTVFAVSIGCTIYISVRFYKNLYTNEGYLMHTLPVTPRQLIVSKLLVGSLHYIITTLLIMASVFALIFTAMAHISPETYREFFSGLSTFEREIGMSFSAYLGLVSVTAVIGSVSSLLMIYAAISIGQLASKHKILVSIGAYIAITTLMQIVSMIGSFSLILNMEPWRQPTVQITAFSPFGNMFFMAIVMTVVSGIVCYIITEMIMKKKLNLD